MYNATLVVQEQLKKAGINAEVESYDFSTFMEHRADPKQFSMFITSNSYNMLQSSFLYWIKAGQVWTVRKSQMESQRFVRRRQRKMLLRHGQICRHSYMNMVQLRYLDITPGECHECKCRWCGLFEISDLLECNSFKIETG